MGNGVKDERKARGGTARSLALTPERRKEIAQKAALSRWGPPKLVVKAAPMLKGIPALKRLTVSSSFPDGNPGDVASTISENGQILRTFSGSPSSAGERVQSYLAALQDLGIEIDLTELNDDH